MFGHDSTVFFKTPHKVKWEQQVLTVSIYSTRSAVVIYVIDFIDYHFNWNEFISIMTP